MVVTTLSADERGIIAAGYNADGTPNYGGQLEIGHPNYSALFSLLMASLVNKIDIGVGIDPNPNGGFGAIVQINIPIPGGEI